MPCVRITRPSVRLSFVQGEIMKKRLLLLVAIVGTSLIVFACGQDSSSGVEKTAEKYLRAMEAHDMETLTKMTHPDVVVVRGRARATGREKFLAPIEFEAGVNATFEFKNIVVRGDTVDVDMIERNDLASIMGFTEFHHFPRFIFTDGVLVQRESRRATPELKAYAQELELMRSWLKTERPDINMLIQDEQGRYKTTRKTGELLVKAANEWRAATADD